MPRSPHIAQILLEKAHTPEVASTLFTEKVLQKPLRLRPTSPDLGSHDHDARALRRMERIRKEAKTKRRKKVKPLSAKEKRITGTYDIPKDAKKYEIYVPLHRMWLGYMGEILGLEEGKSAYMTAKGKGSILASADYHGAELTVVRSRCAGLVGLQGIVIRDTKFTFQIITKGNELKAIPKRYTVFQFELPQNPGGQVETQESQPVEEGKTKTLQNLVFELHGSQFESRAADRATKKFKPKHLKDL